LDLTPEIDAFYQRVMVETDYQALAEAQKNFETAMRGQTIRVSTPAGTDITV
jgi:leucyl aminopeptidase (aminopeptidase T)